MADGTQPEVVRPEKTHGGAGSVREKSEAPGPGKFTPFPILSSLLSVSLSLLPSPIPLIFKFLSLPLFSYTRALGQRQMEIFSGDPAARRRKISTSDPWAEADAGERGRHIEGQAEEVAPPRSSARLLAAQVPGLIHVFSVAEDDGSY